MSLLQNKQSHGFSGLKTIYRKGISFLKRIRQGTWIFFKTICKVKQCPSTIRRFMNEPLYREVFFTVRSRATVRIAFLFKGVDPRRRGDKSIRSALRLRVIAFRVLEFVVIVKALFRPLMFLYSGFAPAFKSSFTMLDRSCMTAK